MHLLRSLKIKHAIAFGIGAGIGVLYLMSAIAANAESIGNVSVATNGQTIVRGARVIRVTASEITAVTEWGAATMQWRIFVSGKTKFAPEREEGSLSKSFKVGERIGFSGRLDHRAVTPTVVASTVRNESVLQSATVLDGNVVGFAEHGFVIQTDSGTSTIAVGTGTIMTKDGNRALAKDLVLGETVKAFGTFNMRSRIMQAERIVTASLPEIPNTGSQQKQGIFSNIFAWIASRSGALSVR